MIKGFNRRVVVMKNPDSKMFDEAFFVVKENAVFDRKEKSPVEAAKKIIRDLEEESRGKKKHHGVEIGRAILFTLLGIAIGILVSVI